MNPYLSQTGRWVLASGMLFIFAGVVTSSPLILLVGQVHIALLAASVMLSVPSALALDRRMITLEIEADGAAPQHAGHVVGSDVSVALQVLNQSDVALNFFEAKPFAASGISAPEAPSRVHVPSRHRGTGNFTLRGKRCGRWFVHGFDVSVCDPLGLVESRDYLPASHAFEFYPRAGRLLPRGSYKKSMAALRRTAGEHLVQEIGSGTELRELREFRAGDALRDVAWKQSLRTRQLMSREYEREITSSTYVFLDISSSMRGGQWPGQKLEYGIRMAVDLFEVVLATRDKVGLVTFDEKLYGHVEANSSARQFKRLLHHLVGLNGIVDEELTELDEIEVERLIADYLLVQERLDFRKGAQIDSPSGVNAPLLNRWLTGIMPEVERAHDSPVLGSGVLSSEPSKIRRFLQLRGVEVPYRVEARLGMKERGLLESMEHLVRSVRDPQRIVVVSDLCGIMNFDVLTRAVRLGLSKHHQIRFIAPFTPSFYEDELVGKPKYEIVKELFTSAEAEERNRVAAAIRTLGVPVNFVSR